MYLMFTISYENKSNLLKYIISCSAILLRYSHVNLANQILFAFNDRYYFITKLETIMQLCAKVDFSPKRKSKIKDNV